jgi:hypothetical protein
MNISPSNPCNWDSEVNLTKVNKDSNLKDRVGIQMFQLIFEVRQQDVEEVAAADPEAPLENGFNTTISWVLGVKMSSSLAGRHWRTARRGRNLSLRSSRISSSSMVEHLNIS